MRLLWRLGIARGPSKGSAKVSGTLLVKGGIQWICWSARTSTSSDLVGLRLSAQH